MTLLLDTNVVSELRKVGDGRADAHVVAWIAARDTASFYLSAITLMELELGILRMERRDVEQGARLRLWMTERVLPAFQGRILPVDAAVALRCARLHVPDPCAERDALTIHEGRAYDLELDTEDGVEANAERVMAAWREDRAGSLFFEV